MQAWAIKTVEGGLYVTGRNECGHILGFNIAEAMQYHDRIDASVEIMRGILDLAGDVIECGTFPVPDWAIHI